MLQVYLTDSEAVNHIDMKPVLRHALPMTHDYTTDPPTLRINQFVKTEVFDLLRPMGETNEHGETEYVYQIPQLAALTSNLMHWLDIAYDSHSEQPHRKLDEFSAEERRLYYPFAFMLACLAGNAFRTGQLNPIFADPDAPASPETISQFIPDAYLIIQANGGDQAEVRAMITAAARPTNSD